jgi:hypothetical protein
MISDFAEKQVRLIDRFLCVQAKSPAEWFDDLAKNERICRRQNRLTAGQYNFLNIWCSQVLKIFPLRKPTRPYRFITKKFESI